MFIQILKWFVRIVLIAVIATGMVACTQLGLNYASLEVDGKPLAWPALDQPNLAALGDNRETALRALEDHVFGPIPRGLSSRIVSHRVVDPVYADGAGTLEEFTIAFGDGVDERQFNLAVAFPNRVSTPGALIINQTFCPNRISFQTNALSPARGYVGMCGDDAEARGWRGYVVTRIFGRYIAAPPVQRILNRGYAIASIYGSDIVPDAAVPARISLARFPSGARGRPTGTIAAWAAGYAAALDVLERDARIDASRTAVMGHSRYAKAALVAGASEPRIEAVIAHQAGTGGSALSRNKPGESVAYITRTYPHWFAPAYADFDAGGANTTPTDMHMLIALNAPKKVLLGNGRRDVWSDPNGSYRAALAADAAWKARAKTGLDQSGMRDLNLSADLVFYMRTGGHAIIKRDWDTFLDFLDVAMPGGAKAA